MDDYADTLYIIILIKNKNKTNNKSFKKFSWYCLKLRVCLVVDYSTMCRNSCKLSKHDVGEVIDYADTVSANSLTMQTRCWRLHWLRRHGMGIVNNYSERSMTTRTLLENFEGFSQILKEQSGEKRYLGVFTNPIMSAKLLITQTWCWRSQRLHGHWTRQRLCGHFRKTLKASHRFKGTIR